jgi:spore coat polysaccharide biosynthesis protein SpsF (cytidylyltransferase family)
MRTRAGIILQARYNSTRLPGKALEVVAGRTILEHCLRRLIKAGVARVVLATTWEPEDDVLAAIARRLGVGVYRGESADVLARFANAARFFGLDPVLRATGDNPAVDVQAPGRVLAALRTAGADYVIESGLPCGAAVEGMTADALERAAMLAEDAYDREHVTPIIRSNRDIFNVVEVSAPASLTRAELRLTIDTREDLERLRELFFRTQSDDPSLASLIAASGGKEPLYTGSKTAGSHVAGPTHPTHAVVRREVA